jgi:hypothetical protein
LASGIPRSSSSPWRDGSHLPNTSPHDLDDTRHGGPFNERGGPETPFFQVG